MRLHSDSSYITWTYISNSSRHAPVSLPLDCFDESCQRYIPFKMTMALPRPSMAGNRPAYLDNLFRDNPPRLPKSPSLRSANSSISFNSTSPIDARMAQTHSRPLSPAFEEDSDDRMSVRSLSRHLSPRRRIRDILNRRTYPQVQETLDYPPSRPTPSLSNPSSRRPSLPKLQTTFSSPPRKGYAIASKPLPAIPQPKAEELKCQRCYYFVARNCNGYVMGGSHGDACETCAVSELLVAS